LQHNTRTRSLCHFQAEKLVFECCKVLYNCTDPLKDRNADLRSENFNDIFTAENVATFLDSQGQGLGYHYRNPAFCPVYSLKCTPKHNWQVADGLSVV